MPEERSPFLSAIFTDLSSGYGKTDIKREVWSAAKEIDRMPGKSGFTSAVQAAFSAYVHRMGYLFPEAKTSTLEHELKRLPKSVMDTRDDDKPGGGDARGDTIDTRRLRAKDKRVKRCAAQIQVAREEDYAGCLSLVCSQDEWHEAVRLSQQERPIEMPEEEAPPPVQDELRPVAEQEKEDKWWDR